MVRPYAVKGVKRKKREEEVYDIVEEEQVAVEREEKATSSVEKAEEEVDGKEKKTEEEEAIEFELPGIPIVPSVQKPKSGVIFVLERASLEYGKVGKTEQILNSDEHSNFLRKHNKNPADYRPDIVHQRKSHTSGCFVEHHKCFLTEGHCPAVIHLLQILAILTILDSPLNKAGRLQALYVKTEKGVLFEVKPHVRIPRTFKRFCGVMLQLLQKLSVGATNNREKLLRVIKNPVTRHLPVNSRKIGLSHSSPKLVPLQSYVATASDDMNLVFVVGAMAHGKIDPDYIDDFISVSNYPLSAAWCISRICNSLETKWNIL